MGVGKVRGGYDIRMSTGGEGGLAEVNRKGRHVPHTEGKEEDRAPWSDFGNRCDHESVPWSEPLRSIYAGLRDK